MGRTGRRKPRPGNPSDPVGLAVAVRRFQQWMRTHAYSPSTVEDRGQQIDGFIAWTEERGITRPSEVTHALLTRYQRHLFHYRKRDDAPLGLLTQQMRIVAVRVFFKWLAKHGM
ncbi:MAG: recombinase XerD, partial [Candidatus Binatia bacterium]